MNSARIRRNSGKSMHHCFRDFVKTILTEACDSKICTGASVIRAQEERNAEVALELLITVINGSLRKVITTHKRHMKNDLERMPSLSKGSKFMSEEDLTKSE